MFTHEDMHEIREATAHAVAKQGEYGMIAFLFLGFLLGAIVF